jgi:methyltransferase (TIGR00027 family)
MAEGIALHRVDESRKPEGERIFYDPYAIRFVDPATLAFAAGHPAEAKAMKEQMENLFPGLGNSIRARVRYFDDFVRQCLDEGMEQLVILGAGYDTRAYRIAGLENVKVFEVDHPVTQDVKTAKVREIFGSLPGHVTYVPVDFEVEKLADRLPECGYDRLKKTLFVLEGLVMYIPPAAVDETLSFVVHNSGKGSAIIFDYYPLSVLDGRAGQVGENIRNYVMQAGEPLQFGIEEGTAEAFLEQRGFTRIRNVTARDYKKAYYQGINENRPVCDLLCFVSAEVR